MFDEFLSKILEISGGGTFKEQTSKVLEFVEKLADGNIRHIVKEIGTIPECIKASSSAEKLYAVFCRRLMSLSQRKSESVLKTSCQCLTHTN